MASPDQRGLNNALVEDRPDLSGDDIGRGDDEQELRTRLGNSQVARTPLMQSNYID